MRFRQTILPLLSLAVVGTLGALLLAWRAPIAAVPRPAPTSFDRTTVEAGATLAALGNCVTCHSKADGAPYAGGRPLETPFGTIYTSNITPDPEVGIGGWSRDAFRRALRDGVSRDGHHLYPALPYDHYTNVTAADVDAIYAFLMTRPAVHQAAPETHLPFPYDMRVLLAGWKLLFLHDGPWTDDAGKSAAWNRGGYLVEGLTHCSACHAPRNLLGAERRDQHFGYGQSEDWAASAFVATSASGAPPQPWTGEQVFNYLRHGYDATHGAAAGPMQNVTDNLGSVSDADIQAMSVYLASFTTADAPAPRVQAVEPSGFDAGRTIYTGACAACHSGAQPPPINGIALAASSTVHAPTSENFLHLLLEGRRPDEGTPGPYMPGFGAVLADDQVAALADYLRASVGLPAWTDVKGTLARQRGKAAPT